jgi:hypothetical protein
MEVVETPVQTFYEGPLFDPFGMRAGLQPLPGVPPHGLAPAEVDLGHLGLAGSSRRFEVRPGGSFFGDCIRVVDVPAEEPLAPGFPAFGWSGEELLGGAAMTVSRLRGEISVSFGVESDGKQPFTIDCSQPLSGNDSVLAAPDGYRLESRGNRVALTGPPSRGLLDLTSGRVYDFHFNCEFHNTAIDALLAANPELEAPPLLFPGLPHAGHALAWFTLEEESGELGFQLAAQLFLPLGAGTPLTMPPAASGNSHRQPFPARNSALHPFIFLACTESPLSPSAPPSTPRATGGKSTGGRTGAAEAALRAHENQVVRLICWPERTCFGDDFDLLTDELGGGAVAQSPLFGELEVQIGAIADDCAPFSLRFSAPAPAYEAKFEALLQLLPPGTGPGLLGMRGELAFPRQVYDQRNLSLNSDPYKPSVGVLDATTGRFRTLLRKYLFQDLMMRLLLSEPRTPSDSFAYVAEGAFGAHDGALTLELDGALFIPYPAGYRFPLPEEGMTVAHEGSRLIPFVRLEALELRAFDPLPQERTLCFSGEKHLRGRRTHRVELEVGPADARSGRRPVSLRSGEAAIEGWGGPVLQARHRGRLLTFGGVELPDAGTCHYYLTEADGEAQLQVVSVAEDWDLWYATRA